MYWGFCGSLILATIAYAFKPDTRYVHRKRDQRAAIKEMYC